MGKTVQASQFTSNILILMWKLVSCWTKQPSITGLPNSQHGKYYKGVVCNLMMTVGGSLHNSVALLFQHLFLNLKDKIPESDN